MKITVVRLRISRKDITDVEINVDVSTEFCTGLKFVPECGSAIIPYTQSVEAILTVHLDISVFH